MLSIGAFEALAILLTMVTQSQKVTPRGSLFSPLPRGRLTRVAAFESFLAMRLLRLIVEKQRLLLNGIDWGCWLWGKDRGSLALKDRSQSVANIIVFFDPMSFDRQALPFGQYHEIQIEHKCAGENV